MRYLIILLLACTPAVSASYYVDFSGGSDSNAGTSTGVPWKHIKGMTGCTSTCNSATLTGGDTVYFKGGVTWTSSFPWTLSGGSSSTITYTTDQSWYSGASFSQPVFDYQGAGSGSTGMVVGASWTTLNDLQFVNCSIAQTANSDKCLVYTNTHDVVVTNSTFACECWITIYMPFSDGASHSNFTLTGNDFSHTSGALWFASSAASTTMHNLTYNYNTFHDYTSQIGGGVHGDGALHLFNSPYADATQYADGIQFCNNRFYGDFRNSFAGGGAMTALFFTEGSFSGTICNNDFSYSPAGGAGEFQALILLDGKSNSHTSNWGVYNNSLALIGTNSVSAAFDIVGQTGSNISYKNNIIYSPQYCIYVEDSGSATALTSDYNMLTCSGGLDYVGSIKSYSQWQALGYDANSITGSNPSWVSAPGNENINLGSPAIAVGTDLTGLGITILDSDFSGISRGTSWDIGAYQFSPGYSRRISGKIVKSGRHQ